MKVAIKETRTGKIKNVEPHFAKILVKLGKHEYCTSDAKPAQPSPNQYQRRDMQAATGDELAELRATYQSLVGKRPFMGWDADKLREKIAENRKGEG